MEIAEIAQLLVRLGCPEGQSNVMAAQLDKRAQQLASRNETSYDDALRHLLNLMSQGWAAPKNSIGS